MDKDKLSAGLGLDREPRLNCILEKIRTTPPGKRFALKPQTGQFLLECYRYWLLRDRVIAIERYLQMHRVA